jgi:hypothetical protein
MVKGFLLDRVEVYSGIDTVCSRKELSGTVDSDTANPSLAIGYPAVMGA